MEQLRPLVILDRDGTLIKEPQDFQIDSFEKFELVDGVLSGLNLLKKQGYRFILWTNQDGLGTKNYPLKKYNQIQKLLLQILKSEGIDFDAMLVCPHTPQDKCNCRKPNPELLLASGIEFDPQKTIVIGDRKTDLILAKKLGAQGIQIQTNFYEAAALAVSALSRVEINRNTDETNIKIELSLDNRKKPTVTTGVKMFDHLLTQLLFHAGLGGCIKAKGDLWIDDHHLVEDLGIGLGQALALLIKSRKSANRYSFSLPMDEANSKCLIDISGRIHFQFKAEFKNQKLGDLSTEMISHFFESLAQNLKANIHLQAQGKNDHHIAESLFKSVGKALSQNIEPVNKSFSSTKGSLWN
jgi:imidazoleglycerol-phosphate dehydratase/histidinol-phosphatase